LPRARRAHLLAVSAPARLNDVRAPPTHTARLPVCLQRGVYVRAPDDVWTLLCVCLSLIAAAYIRELSLFIRQQYIRTPLFCALPDYSCN